MSTKIKICGLRRTEDVDFVNEYKPDYIGFIFANTRRKVEYNTAKILKEKLSKEIKAVGVFVDEPIENIVRLCNDEIIDIIQLHGNEDEEYINELRQQTNKPVIKAVRVQNKEQIYSADKLSVDYLLLDTYNKNLVGGTGEVFNWDIVPHNLTKPVFLAGGLSAKNVESAIDTVKPYCVDLSSSVETDGVKDKEKIKQVMEIMSRVKGR